MDETNQLEGVDFRVWGQQPDSLFSVLWDSCAIRMRKNKKSRIKLYHKGQSLLVKNAKAKRSKSKKLNSTRYQAYRDYRKALKVREGHIVRLQSARDSVRLLYDYCEGKTNEKQDSIDMLRKRYKRIKESEFRCLGTWTSKLYEKAIGVDSLESWVTFFDNHRDELEQFYSEMAKEHERCLELRRQQRRIIEAVYSYTPSIDSTDKTVIRDTTVLALSIDTLCRYNTARERGFGPERSGWRGITIDSFMLESRTIIPMAIAMVIPENGDGIYRFDGTNNYSPYKLPFFGRESLKLILISEEGDVYESQIGNQMKVGRAISVTPWHGF